MKGLADRLLPYALAFFSSLTIMVLELLASRLVARHVGASLHIWTSVIGIILAGICLGNVLGGWLADRAEPRRVLGPLYALGAALVVGCLWVNSMIGQTPGLDGLPWSLRTLFVVTVDFLVPATVLGMIGPVVAKMAVDRSRLAGSALGDVYFWGAIGSIVGTFVAGFILIYQAGHTTIVTLVAASLALLAAALGGRTLGIGGLITAALLVADAVRREQGWTGGGAVGPEALRLSVLGLAGHLSALALGVAGQVKLRQARLPVEIEGSTADIEAEQGMPGKSGLGDLAVLAFVASLGFMALEMVAGRLVTRHLGSSVYGWTSVIGVLLAGLSLGNFVGGKIADRIRSEKQASWLFLAASVASILILALEETPGWLTGRIGLEGSLLSKAQSMVGYPWSVRVLLVVTLMFLLPAATMGTVSPVVAKLAVDRLRRQKRTGTAIGRVYAWGMVGSILGTFLAGFVLIDVLGTKGLVLAIATMMALAATALGSVWHAVWAGMPMGLCLIAFCPGASSLPASAPPWLVRASTRIADMGVAWGLREPGYAPDTDEEGAIAYLDESNYYYIKVANSPELDSQKRTLVLDNLIHGYFILNHPEHIEYDYEFIYAQVARRAAEAKALAAGVDTPGARPLRSLFLGGGSYTFPRYLQHIYPGSKSDIAEIDPAVTRANHVALGLPADAKDVNTHWGDARQFVEKAQGGEKYDLIFGDAFNDFSVPWHLTTREFNDKIAGLLTDDGVYMINIIDAYKSDEVARRNALADESGDEPTDADLDAAVAEARRFGGFLGAWVNTAKLTFDHVYVFGTDVPGDGLRETFVVVASKKPIDLAELGRRDGDPLFQQDGANFEPDPYGEEDLKAVDLRSRGIILTDDYAPVENLLAPVAETRGD